jgi:hypothetical protein
MIIFIQIVLITGITDSFSFIFFDLLNKLYIFLLLSYFFILIVNYFIFNE